MDLDERKRRILGAVVRDYVETARPVGSEDLAARHPWGVKSATIRNELADLSDLGLLRQPHTSAGRIPSDRGYRFYVDNLMAAQAVAPGAGADEQAFDLERLLRQTCALLTRMTSYTSVATPPRPAGTRLVRVFVSPAGDGRLLAVGLFSTGQAENRLLSPPPDAPEATAAEIVALGNALGAAFAGRALDAVASEEPAPRRASSPRPSAPATRRSPRLCARWPGTPPRRTRSCWRARARSCASRSSGTSPRSRASWRPCSTGPCCTRHCPTRCGSPMSWW